MGRRKKEPKSAHRENIATAASALFMKKGIDATDEKVNTDKEVSSDEDSVEMIDEQENSTKTPETATTVATEMKQQVSENVEVTA